MIRVMIVDAHPLFLEGVRLILKPLKDIECVGTAHDGAEAVKLAKELLPDIVVMDLTLPTMDGSKAAKQIKSACPDTRVVLLTHCYEPHCIESSIWAGVDGYLLKNAPYKELVDAIRMVYAGEGVFSLEIMKGMISGLSARVDKHIGKAGGLHNRELEVLKCVARGMSNKEVADALYISPHTVGIHLVNIFKKLSVTSRTAAVARAFTMGLIGVTELGGDVPELNE